MSTGIGLKNTKNSIGKCNSSHCNTGSSASKYFLEQKNIEKNNNKMRLLRRKNEEINYI